ncbi:uncharacterized protein B0H18DRAFT_422857 [Fomitopsis serialis]|uniref:uncharacterized protein n=1 Tax=Fomitopsis serialis TaxID=139415 RepID=UPI0020082FF8|nr:uncharacterized protein B0H18DRAFT_422857 [Neoantrodia serialis]KAH9935767.1 hypothetical protein B0H18DRAFT_422857 [Neoantrodia serialis]
MARIASRPMTLVAEEEGIHLASNRRHTCAPTGVLAATAFTTSWWEADNNSGQRRVPATSARLTFSVRYIRASQTYPMAKLLRSSPHLPLAASSVHSDCSALCFVVHPPHVSSPHRPSCLSIHPRPCSFPVRSLAEAPKGTDRVTLPLARGCPSVRRAASGFRMSRCVTACIFATRLSLPLCLSIHSRSCTPWRVLTVPRCAKVGGLVFPVIWVLRVPSNRACSTFL